MEQGTDEKLIIARAEDTARQCERRYSVKFMGFLTPAEAAIIQRHMPSADAKLVFWGGYPNAERKLFVALPEYAEDSELDEIISALEISGRELGTLSHRDYLGSLLGLGIKREKIGDILVTEAGAVAFVLEDIADYIVFNLDKVGRRGVKVKKCEIGEVAVPERKTEKINAVIAALRLDCVVAAALKTSRSKACDAIAAGRVSLNWLENTSVSAAVKAGDTISVKGAGRFILSDENGEENFRTTKKGRIALSIEKLI